MKTITKNIIFVLIVAITLIGCNVDTCQSDNEGLCELENISDFQIEDNAKIIIGVFNESFGKDLVISWNNAYPDYVGMLSYERVLPDEKGELLEKLPAFDLIQVKSENVPLYFNDLIGFDESFSEILDNEKLSKFSGSINQEEYFFIPFDIEGLLFAYNKTMLEEFNVELSDLDKNGLPESIDSFEKIGILANDWRKNQVKYLDQDIENIFSFPLNDQTAMIPFLQNSDYRLIQGVSAEMMNVDEPLLMALKNLKTLGSYSWRYDKSLDNDSDWNYEEILDNQSAPFLLVGNWMYYDYYQTSKAYELVFSKLPQLNELELAMPSSVSGFVLNKDTLYPNAANAVLKHVKEPEGIQVTINNGLIPIVNNDLLNVEGFKIDHNTKQQLKAYQYSEPSPLQAFLQKPQKRGWDILLEVDFRDVIKGVFLGDIKPEAGQIEIIDLISDWLNEEGIVVKGINDE